MDSRRSSKGSSHENMDLEIQQKVSHFEAAINNVLRADLAKLEEKLNLKNTELAEFIQLKSVIQTLKDTGAEKDGFKTKVDLGCNFFVQAQVEDSSKILLNVGLDHYVEFNLDEALVVIDVRTKLLEKQTENLRQQVAMTNAHIKLMLINIGDLQKLNSEK